jgi:hypothetical protein
MAEKEHEVGRRRLSNMGTANEKGEGRRLNLQAIDWVSFGEQEEKERN